MLYSQIDIRTIGYVLSTLMCIIQIFFVCYMGEKISATVGCLEQKCGNKDIIRWFDFRVPVLPMAFMKANGLGRHYPTRNI